MATILANDFVNVSLAGGGFYEAFKVVDVPGNNQVYWTLEDKQGKLVVVGPSLIAMQKVS